MKELNRIGQFSSTGGPVPIPSDWSRAGVSAAALERDSINVLDWLSYCERNKTVKKKH